MRIVYISWLLCFPVESNRLRLVFWRDVQSWHQADASVPDFYLTRIFKGILDMLLMIRWYR